MPLVLTLSSACAGAAPARDACDVAGRFPVRPCATAAHPDRVGVWQDEETGHGLVYDGCHVAFEYVGAREMAPDGELRALAGGAIVVDWRDWGDPPPYHRARARWRDDVLLSISILGERALARWDGSAMRSLHWRADRLRRVTHEAELGSHARRLLCVDRVTPTEAELARERGVAPPREPDPSPPTPLERIVRDAEARREQELERMARERDAAMMDGGAR